MGDIQKITDDNHILINHDNHNNHVDLRKFTKCQINVYCLMFTVNYEIKISTCSHFLGVIIKEVDCESNVWITCTTSP